MNENEERNMLDGAGQGHAVPDHQSSGRPSVVDADMLNDFTELFGPEQAQNWLLEFQAGLKAEATRAMDEGQGPTCRRDTIHHLCGRAGFIGFPALHAACVEYLEAAPSNGALSAACENVRTQALLACEEIDRLHLRSH